MNGFMHNHKHHRMVTRSDRGGVRVALRVGDGAVSQPAQMARSEKLRAFGAAVARPKTGGVVDRHPAKLTRSSVPRRMRGPRSTLRVRLWLDADLSDPRGLRDSIHPRWNPCIDRSIAPVGSGMRIGRRYPRMPRDAGLPRRTERRLGAGLRREGVSQGPSSMGTPWYAGVIRRSCQSRLFE